MGNGEWGVGTGDWGLGLAAYRHLLSAYGCPLGDMGPADNQTSDGAGAFPPPTVMLSVSEGSR